MHGEITCKHHRGACFQPEKSRFSDFDMLGPYRTPRRTKTTALIAFNLFVQVSSGRESLRISWHEHEVLLVQCQFAQIVAHTETIADWPHLPNKYFLQHACDLMQQTTFGSWLRQHKSLSSYSMFALCILEQYFGRSWAWGLKTMHQERCCLCEMISDLNVSNEHAVAESAPFRLTQLSGNWKEVCTVNASFDK